MSQWFELSAVKPAHSRRFAHGVLLPGIQVVGLSFCQQCPQLPGVFVGNGDPCLVVGHSPIQANDPLLHPVQFVRGFLQRGLQGRARTLYQQAAQVGVAAPGDTAQLGLAAAGILPGRQAYPGRKLPAILEVVGIADTGTHSIGGDHVRMPLHCGRLGNRITAANHDSDCSGRCVLLSSLHVPDARPDGFAGLRS